MASPEGHESDLDHIPPHAPEPDPDPTPDPEPPPEPDPTPAPGASGDRLDRLEGIVNGLVDIVAALAPKDEAPTKTPWTHRGSRRDDR